jgi:electron transport complex protein RnfC
MHSLFAKRVAPHALPSRAHRLIVDPVACWGIAQWLKSGKSFTERPVQIFSEEDAPASAAGSARLVMARLGESLAALCERYHISLAGDREIIVNGMLAGRPAHPTDCIDAATESLAIRTTAAPDPISACITCGWCVDVCPTGLTPVRLTELTARLSSPQHAPSDRDLSMLRSREARESLNCIGCGLCSYVCPARLSLTAATLQLRDRITAAPLSEHPVPENAP